MAISRSMITTWAQFNVWMASNVVGKFASAFTLDGNSATLVGKNGNTILTFDEDSSRAEPTNMKVYNSTGDYWECNHGVESGTNPVIRWCAVCNNGALIHFSDEESLSSSRQSLVELLITKNQNGHTAVVISANTTSPTAYSYKGYLYSDLSVFSEDDVCSARKYLQISQRKMEQLQLAPFVTNMETNGISYTPDAYMILTGSYSDVMFATIMADGVTYMTNGYWAISDGESNVQDNSEEA